MSFRSGKIKVKKKWGDKKGKNIQEGQYRCLLTTIKRKGENWSIITYLSRRATNHFFLLLISCTYGEGHPANCQLTMRGAVPHFYFGTMSRVFRPPLFFFLRQRKATVLFASADFFLLLSGNRVVFISTSRRAPLLLLLPPISRSTVSSKFRAPKESQYPSQKKPAADAKMD